LTHAGTDLTRLTDKLMVVVNGDGDDDDSEDYADGG
jgi:hypothetical protein